MSYSYNVAFDDVWGSLVAFNGVGAVFSSALNIAVYVLTALGLYTIAKRRGIRKPWLAWIPVVNVWTLGSISDQYRYVVKGESKSKRKILLTLSIIMAVIYVVIIILGIAILGNVIFGAMNRISDYQLMNKIMGPVLGLLGMCVPLVGVAIAHAILYYMALYDVYTSCDPNNNVMFLVLSIVFNVTKPFFLFFSRNKDDGMPPRRQETPSYIPEQAPIWESEPQEGTEPWQESDNE